MKKKISINIWKKKQHIIAEKNLNEIKIGNKTLLYIIDIVIKYVKNCIQDAF